MLRMATGDESPPSMAVRKALLALASLDRDGLQPKALEMKLLTIRALAASANSLRGEKDIMRHVAANILLLTCEVCKLKVIACVEAHSFCNLGSRTYEHDELLDLVYCWCSRCDEDITAE